MQAVIPRWEWRTFATSFGDADQRFGALQPSSVQESDEVYFLAPTSDANVKIRDHVMDIKMLEQINADGLEQWCPVMKCEFPLPPAAVQAVCTALRVAPPSPRPAYTLEQLQAELTAPSGGVRVVHVHKRRQRFTIGGCMGELTDVIADGQRTRTVAIEFEDPARVHAVVREMDLDRFENTSYPRGLKRLLGLCA